MSETAIDDLPPARNELDAIFRFFCSLKLTLANLLGLFLGMIAGTFINPGGAALSEIEASLAARPVMLWAYRVFELHNVFQSWWFTLLLLSLALNLIACSIERLPRIYFLIRDAEKRLDRVRGVKLRGSTTAIVPVEFVISELRKRGYRVSGAERDGGADLFAEKGRFSRYGVWVVHLSLLVILGGGIVGRLTAFEGTASVPEGGGEASAITLRTPDGTPLRRALGFTVICDEFRLREFEDGRPKAYESDLRVLDPKGQLIASGTINVNHPLRVNGVTIYQASYSQLEQDPKAKLRVVDNETGESRDVLVSAGESVGDYKPVSYSENLAGQGPALQLQRDDGNTFWVFSRMPDFDKRNRPDRYSFSFGGLKTPYATGLQIARDPSTPIVYLGCFFLFLGTAIAFYTAHKRVWVRVSADGVQIGAAAHRNPEAFKQDFEQLCAAVLVGQHGGAKAAA